MKNKAKLPKNIIDDLVRNSTFNMFGLVNISRLKASTDCKIPDKELKEMIQERFGHEMATGNVEFI
jgi:hypothetical protein